MATYTPTSTIKPAKVDLTLSPGATFYPLWVLGGAAPIDISGWHFRMQIIQIVEGEKIVLYDLADRRSPDYSSLSGTLGTGTINTSEDGLQPGSVQAILLPVQTAEADGLNQVLIYTLIAQTDDTLPTPTPTPVWDEWFFGKVILSGGGSCCG